MIKPLEKSAVLLNPHKMLILFVCVSLCMSIIFLFDSENFSGSGNFVYLLFLEILLKYFLVVFIFLYSIGFFF